MKFNFTKFIVLLIGMPCILNSCVKYDFLDYYDEDSLEQSFHIPRSKLSKDGMNLMNTLGPEFPLHVLSCYIEDGCLARGLLAKIGSEWINYASYAVSQSYNFLKNTGHLEDAEEKYRIYLNEDNSINTCMLNQYYDDLYSFIQYRNIFGLTPRSGTVPCVGDLIITKMFSSWGGRPNKFHCSYVTSVSVQDSMYMDSDGNLFSFEFIGNIYY